MAAPVCFFLCYNYGVICMCFLHRTVDEYKKRYKKWYKNRMLKLRVTPVFIYIY